MAVTVSFSIFFDDEQSSIEVNEDELFNNYELYKKQLSEMPQILGSVIISSPGQPQILVYDDLLNSVRDVCFDSIANLANGIVYTYSYFESGESIEMVPSGNSISISGEHILPAMFDRDELLLSLYSCGQRFMNFIEDYLKLDKIILGLLITKSGLAKQLLLVETSDDNSC
jgi:hypothetical protein